MINCVCGGGGGAGYEGGYKWTINGEYSCKEFFKA